MKTLFQIATFSLLFLGCKKEEKENPNNTTPPVPHTYTSSVYMDNLPPVMGGCLDTNGFFVSFNSPLLANSTFGANALISAKVRKYKNSNLDSIITDFGNFGFASGTYAYRTINSLSGVIPGTLRVALTYNKSGQLFMATNSHGYNNLQILNVANGQMEGYKTVDGLTSLTSRRNDLFAMSTPIYDSGNNLIKQATIYQIDSLGTISTYFSFPSNITFAYNCGTQGSGSVFFPTDVLIDIKAAPDNCFYITSGYDNIIYKLDKNKNLSIFSQNIFCPVSIDLDSYNRLYVVSAPRFQEGANPNYTMTKPVQVYQINASESKIIYEGSLLGWTTNCMYNSIAPDKCIENDVNFNITVNSKGQLFLEDPILGRIILIQ